MPKLKHQRQLFLFPGLLQEKLGRKHNAIHKTAQGKTQNETGVPKGEEALCKLAREVLDITTAELRPGITTGYLDEVYHKACVQRNAYPSPLNYNHFPKPLYTSPNKVVCHGIPDQRILLDSDILNLDIFLYHGGYHADLNKTYYVGDRAKTDPDSVKLIEITQKCLNKAIELVKLGTPIRDFGRVILRSTPGPGAAALLLHGVAVV
ncbi:MAG: hypothetical protein LQ337_004612 [Flavoplaca oasis]|nr:MAG: hypothetical protein LQ337_004612 [Flavoplaca oasis]